MRPARRGRKDRRDLPDPLDLKDRRDLSDPLDLKDLKDRMDPRGPKDRRDLSDPDGPEGPDGPPGPQGPPGVLGFYRVSASYTVLGNAQPTLRSDSCAAGDVVTGGGFTSNAGDLAMRSNGPDPAVEGWLLNFQNKSGTATVDVWAICSDLMP